MFIQSQEYFGADTELHVQLMRYLPRDDAEVHVALTTARSPEDGVDLHSQVGSISDLAVVPVNFGGGGKASKARAAVASLRTLRNYVKARDIAIVHGTEKPRDAFMVGLLATTTRARGVVHMHVNYGEWLSPLVKWALRRASGIFAVSTFARDSLLRAGLPPMRTYTVLNGLDLASGGWEHGDRQAVRREFDISADTLVIGVISRLFMYKGHLDLLAALARIDDQLPPYRVLIVGDDDVSAYTEGGPFSEEIRAAAARLGLSGRLIMAGFRTDIADLMASFDIYAMPSWEEPFGMVYLEAMAMEKPTVAWDQAGPAEIVVDGETGFLLAPKDIPALAARLLDLARSPELRARMGLAGRRRVLEHFTSQRMCDDVMHAYRDIVSMTRR